MSDAPQTVTIGGQTITAEQVAEILEAHPQLTCGRLVVEPGDVATFMCEVRKPDMTLAPTLRKSVAALEIDGRLLFVDDGTIPPDAPLIEDRR